MKLRLILGLTLFLALVLVGQSQAADLYVGPGETYTEIQPAVDAALSGDTIHIAAGTYTEQVLIVGKDLTLAGAGTASTIIKSPATLGLFYSTSYDHYPVLGVEDGVVHLSQLTIDGDGQGNTNYKFMGTDFHNAGGSITDVAYVRVRNTPFSGAQHGVSLYLYNEDGTARTFAVANVTVDDFQKNAMAIFAADGTDLTASVTGCEITGQGPTDVTAQNGIQINGADLTVTGNTVRDIAWDGPTWTASGCIFDLSTGTVSNNVLERTQTAMYVTSAPLTITGNQFLIPSVQQIGTGIQLTSMDLGYAKADHIDVPQAQRFETFTRKADGAKATQAYVITGNDFALDPAVTDPSGVYGVFAYNYMAYDDLDVTINNNAFTGLEIAAIAADYAPTDGTFLNADYDDNAFNACTMGVYSTIPAIVSAENCWWGAPDGPGPDLGTGHGAQVSLNVDVDPWVTDLETLVYQPDPLNLNAAAPTGEVVFQYLGGATGRIYAYSIDVVWDPAVATAGAPQFTRPDGGPFASAQPFIAQELAPGHVRIDAAIGGAVPGIFDGPLFKALFTAAAGVDGGESSFAVTVNDLRDWQNNDLFGLVPDLDTDPELLVDLVAPVISDVLVTDTTLPSTDWTRDTHTITVAATVLEGNIATLSCDLGAFGGTMQQLVDAAVTGNVYTWTLASATGMGDGPVAATVTCVDGQSQTAVLADDITADNTAPAQLSGLAAAPGHEQIHLLWDDPAADGGSPLQGVTLRAATWGGYPHYVGAFPDGPAAVDAGLEVNAAPVFGGALDWAVVPRDVYALSGFVTDLVGNISPVSDTARATNYWLGDTDGDGYVTVVPDVHDLGNTYGLEYGETGYDGNCDVGPVEGFMGRGIPNPQSGDDPFTVEFEDLMVFAMNFGEVNPLLNLTPGETPDMSWEQLDASTWVLRLSKPSAGLQGVHLAADLPEGVSCQVSAGAMVVAQSAPTFLKNIEANGLDAGLAVLGQGAQLTGQGEMLRVVTSEPVTGLEVRVQARDVMNNDLVVDMPQATSAEDLPRVHNLAQNTPNPFNPATTIVFELPRTEHVRLDVYGMDGRLVHRLVNDNAEAGRHEVTWRGTDQHGRRVATGAYFYVLEAGDFRQVRKMMLVK